MPVYAQKRLKVGHDDATDQPIYRDVGEVVPEAAQWSWQTRAQLERAGYVKDIPETTSDAGVAAVTHRGRSRKD